MIDGHAHLNEIEPIEVAIEKARQAGIQGIIAVGMDLESNRQTLALGGRFSGFVHPAIGYHPWSVTLEGVEENLAFIREHLHHCIALGEVGLDYGAKAKKKLQQEVFARVLAIAAERDKPVILHSRYSHARTHRIVKEAGIRRAVFHWYSGALEVLEGILQDGYFISCTPALAYSPPHQAAVKKAPIEHILVETDAPVAYQGKISEPFDLLVTLQELSRLKEMDFKQVAEITFANLKGLFALEA